MPLTAAQLAIGANYQLQSYAKHEPIDQFTTQRPLAKWFIDRKEESIFGNGKFNESVRFTNASNYQNYTGDDQVSYNKKDTVRWAVYQHYEAHDGFSINETELANNGILLTDDKNAKMAGAEKIQLVHKLKENFTTLRDGFQENFDKELHLDGSANPNAVPGLDAIVSLTPNTGTVGGINAATFDWWRNFARLNIATSGIGDLIDAMEKLFRECTAYGKLGNPDFIVVGSEMYDAIQADSLKVLGRQINLGQSSTGGVTVDPSTKALAFKGVPIVWDPTFDVLDAQLGLTTNKWSKRGYMLNSKAIKLRPVNGRWLVQRNPPRVYDRYVYYFGITADYGLTCCKRNSLAVFSIA